MWHPERVLWARLTEFRRKRATRQLPSSRTYGQTFPPSTPFLNMGREKESVRSPLHLRTILVYLTISIVTVLHVCHEIRVRSEQYRFCRLSMPNWERTPESFSTQFGEQGPPRRAEAATLRSALRLRPLSAYGILRSTFQLCRLSWCLCRNLSVWGIGAANLISGVERVVASIPVQVVSTGVVFPLSAPPPPRSSSLPPMPSMMSLPPRPQMMSALGVSVMVSPAEVPLLVQALKMAVYMLGVTLLTR